MQRLDILMVEKGLVSSRTHAQRLIKNGRVSIDVKGCLQPVSKPGLKVDSDTHIAIEADDADRFVSRGALKLLGALEHFPIELDDKIAIDVGQSTGGFTDCLLQHGCKHVVGIEVGHDQLAERLRLDERVTCYEGMNARALSSDLLKHTQGGGYDMAVMDVSFISQTKILPSLVPLIADDGFLVSLVKPQFEVGKSNIGSGGIVKDTSLFPLLKNDMIELCLKLGMQVHTYIESPIKGGDGNREFLLIAQKGIRKGKDVTLTTN